MKENTKLIKMPQIVKPEDLFRIPKDPSMEALLSMIDGFQKSLKEGFKLEVSVKPSFHGIEFDRVDTVIYVPVHVMRERIEQLKRAS